MLVLTPVIRVVAVVFGAAVFGTGVAAVFVTENGTGAAALLAIGAAAMALAVLGDRVKSVEMGGVSLTIRDIARETYGLARDAEQRGDEASAAGLRVVARELEALARGYRRLRGSMRASKERTRALEHVVAEARNLARPTVCKRPTSAPGRGGNRRGADHRPGPDEGNPDLRDLEAALDAIDDPRSGFEQYHGVSPGRAHDPGSVTQPGRAAEADHRARAPDTSRRPRHRPPDHRSADPRGVE